MGLVMMVNNNYPIEYLINKNYFSIYEDYFTYERKTLFSKVPMTKIFYKDVNGITCQIYTFNYVRFFKYVISVKNRKDLIIEYQYRFKQAFDNPINIINKFVLQNNLSNDRVFRDVENGTLKENKNQIDTEEKIQRNDEALHIAEESVAEKDLKIKKENIEETYYFMNINEFTSYIQICNKNNKTKNIIWGKGDNYISVYKKAYEEFERGNYERSLSLYYESLLANPIGVMSRIEICNCHIKMRNFNSAIEILNSMNDFILSKEEIANYYRKLGYIYCEMKLYRLSYCCYKYSLDFFDSKVAMEEIKYLNSVDSTVLSVDDYENYLLTYNVHLFKK